MTNEELAEQVKGQKEQIEELANIILSLLDGFRNIGEGDDGWCQQAPFYSDLKETKEKLEKLILHELIENYEEWISKTGRLPNGMIKRYKYKLPTPNDGETVTKGG